MDVKLKDFSIKTQWELDEKGEKWENNPTILKYIIDRSTGRKYWNESAQSIRIKCSLLLLGTLLVHFIAGMMNVAYRALKLLSLSHFWIKKADEQGYFFLGRAQDAGIDFLRMFLQPFVFLGLELSALYGLFSPLDGRKLYASLERAEYGGWILAPCFQPDAECHLFGGDPNRSGAW